MAVVKVLFGDDGEILSERDFQVLLLANVLAPLGSSVLSPILDSLITPFGTTPANIGLVMSFFTAPAIVMIPLAGLLADRYGRKPVLVSAILIYGAAGSAIAFTTEFRVVLGLRLLQGVAFGGLAPIIITSIGDRYDGTREATAQGIRFTNTGLTQVVFPLLSGVLVVVAWQYPFLIFAISFPIAVVVYRSLDDPTTTGNPDAPSSTGDSTGLPVRAVFEVLSHRRARAMVIARGFPVVIWFGFLTYNSVIVVRVMDGTPTQAGLLTALASLTFAFAASQAGRITGLFESRLYPLIGANVCLGVGFGLFLYAPSLLVGGLGIAVAGVGIGLTLSMYRSIITGLVGGARRGGLVGLAESFGRVMATLTPIVMGGFIALSTPDLGLGPAVQRAGLGAAIVGSVGGIVCLLVASRSPPIADAE